MNGEITIENSYHVEVINTIVKSLEERGYIVDMDYIDNAAIVYYMKAGN